MTKKYPFKLSEDHPCPYCGTITKRGVYCSHACSTSAVEARLNAKYWAAHQRQRELKALALALHEHLAT